MTENKIAEIGMPVVSINVGSIDVENFEELESILSGYLEQYKVTGVMKVTPQSYSTDKKLKAHLNKLVTALEDKRKNGEREYKAPVTVYHDKMKHLSDMVREALVPLSDGIQEFDNEVKANRQAQNLKIIAKLAEENGVSASAVVYDPKWNNKTSDYNRMIENVQMQINQKAKQKEQYESDVTVIRQQADALQLPSNPFIENLDHSDLAKILEQMKIAKQQSDELAQEQIKRAEATRAIKESQEEIKGSKVVNIATGEIVGDILTFDLRVKGTLDQMNKLAAYMKEEHIKFSRLEAKTTQP